jgi:serine/threonine-protein phosphatase 2A regulatory subunit B'
MDLPGLSGGGGATPPRVGTFTSRLRTGPKDTIPMVGKPPRKQRSSRFVVTEKVEIERLPPFLGAYLYL